LSVAVGTTQPKNTNLPKNQHIMFQTEKLDPSTSTDSETVSYMIGHFDQLRLNSEQLDLHEQVELYERYIETLKKCKTFF